MPDFYELLVNNLDFGSHIEPDFDELFLWKSDEEAPVQEEDDFIFG
jgi:hypothetical protein